MGLIKAAAGALGGALGDAWQDAIHCPTMDNQTVACHGVKMANPNDSRTSNTKGSANVITNKSWIIVEQNVCMLTIDNGKITGVVTEPGRYQFVNSSAPSVFAGEIGDAAKDVIQRFIYGGTPSYEQQVIYINLQRLPGIRFGTGTPVPYFDPRYNTTIEILKEFIKNLRVNEKKEREITQKYIDLMATKTPSQNQTIGNLSGGNQQKVLIGRWLSTNPEILILDEPTRGIDVGAKSEIYAIMNDLVKTGVSIIMISSELPEIINMSDRVYVMAEGKVTGCIEHEEVSQESIMQLAAI